MMGDDIRRSDWSASAGSGAKDADASARVPGLLRTVKSACDMAYAYFFPTGEGESGSDGATTSSKSDSATSPHTSVRRRCVSSLSSAYNSEGAEMTEEEKVRLVSALGVLLREPYRPIFTGDVSQGGQWGITRISHCRQLATWDCGITCIQMVLRWLRDDESGQWAAITGNQWGAEVEMTMDERSERKWMLDTVETESVWTIDLVIALERLLDKGQREMFDFPTCQCSRWDHVSASYLFCSTNFGVDESYNEFGYYKNAFSKDEARVTKRFELAKELGLPILCLSKLKMTYVIDIVSRKHCVAVVLVDNRVLVDLRGGRTKARKKARISVDEESGDNATGNIQGIATEIDFLAVPKNVTAAKSNDESTNSKAPFATASTSAKKKEVSLADNTAYAGHYVLLCGLSTSPNDISRAREQDEQVFSNFCLVIKNPGSINSTDFVTPSHFERAWRASGTDDDIIFISKHNTR